VQVLALPGVTPSFMLGCRHLGNSPKGTIVTYIASPRSAADSSERADDCEQCLTSAFLHLSRLTPSDEDGAEIGAILTTSAVQAGWAEQEVREALIRLRFQYPKHASSNDRIDLQDGSGLAPSHFSE
jgi:hypothetical protein